MKYVLVSNSRGGFISGVFSNLYSLNQHLELSSEEAKKSTSIEKINLEYPFYLTEDERGFWFRSEIELQADIQRFINEIDIRDEGYYYTNLYLIHQDFIPPYPGKDCMGRLPHYHIENETLKIIQQEGFKSFLQHYLDSGE